MSIDVLGCPQPDIPEIVIDLGKQADIISVVLAAVNERNWIRGFSSRGYYPPVLFQKKSGFSSHGDTRLPNGLYAGMEYYPSRRHPD